MLEFVAALSIAASVENFYLQDIPYSVESSSRAAPSGASFLVGYGIDLSGNQVVEFYRTSTKPEAFIAVRSLLTPQGRDDQNVINSVSCPQIQEVLSALSDLPSTNIRIPGFSPWSSLNFPAGPVTSGANYTVWGTARQADGGFAELRVSANAGILAESIQRYDSHLRPCWNPVSP